MSVFGFKEWKLVCDAMERGEQAIILRKGGISEGRRGFQWSHDEFFLFPTYFHEQAERLDLSWKPEEEAPTKERDEIRIQLFAKIVKTWEIDDLDKARALADLHVWNDEVIEERFGYGDNDELSLALTQLSKLPESWTLANRKGFGGCRSWLKLPHEEGLPEDWRQQLQDVTSAEQLKDLEAKIEERL
ncbi:MAG: DUF1802 family protein [Verrucomicrobiota bacterium]